MVSCKDAALCTADLTLKQPNSKLLMPTGPGFISMSPAVRINNNKVVHTDLVDVGPRQEPKYAHQLAMGGEDSRMPDPPVENKTKEDWSDSYDITVTVPTTLRLYEKYKWNEERIHRLEALIARFARMSSVSSEHVVAEIYSLDGDQMDMFDSLKKRSLGQVCNMKMYSYENFSTFLNRKISKIDNAWDDFSDFLES